MEHVNREENRGCFLCAENMEVHLGKRPVIRGLSFRLRPGLVGVLGPNGAGKTTLMRGILGVGPAVSGRVWLETGEKQMHLKDLNVQQRSRHLAYVPQETARCAGLTVSEFVVMGRTPYLPFPMGPGKKDWQAAREAIASLGMEPFADRPMDCLSGGERKLAYLARARAQGASWMLLDEPAAGLDFGRQQEFFEELGQFLYREKRGALVTIHDPLLAYRFCDQLLILEQGERTALLDRREKNFEDELIRRVGTLYDMDGALAAGTLGTTIIWRKRENAEVQRIRQGGEPRRRL